ncbi:hypothetical protein ESCO_006690 [Escovopsis weberi]|uniref:Uncharacterized protein n=1 Tax=Escovopsis weberi TaxID=150374 RepID=A0A0M9VXP3_ESCWE|nr:hypothetical protein ESCO_006690 [Escovopsis weberi]
MMLSRALQDLFFYTSRRRYGNGHDRGNGYENIDDALDECKPQSYEIEKSDSGLVILSHLLSFARDQPNHWVCETCTALHPVSRGDSPLRPSNSTCPQGWRQSPHNRYGHPSFRLSHRHIQLAFKYTRLKKWRHHLHLRRLLAETHADFVPNPLCPTLEGEFSAYPKIVNGRYLLFSTWTFTPGEENASERGMGSLRICQHQSFVGDPRLLPPDRTGTSIDNNNDHGGGGARAPDPERAQQQVPKTALSRIVRSAFRRPHHEICSSCAHCPTDFSVQVTPERAIVRVWQDFGGDGSPLDPAWTVHTEADQDPRQPCDPRDAPSAAEHKSGSIRESFGHCMREALHDIRNRKESCEAMGNVFIF